MNQPELLKLVVRELQKEKKVQLVADTISLDGFGPKLSKGERVLMEQIVSKLKSEGLETSGAKEIQKRLPKTKNPYRNFWNWPFKVGC